jgi:hypothetical protein
MVAEIDRVARKISNALMSLVDLARQDRSHTGNFNPCDTSGCLAVVGSCLEYIFFLVPQLHKVWLSQSFRRVFVESEV